MVVDFNSDSDSDSDADAKIEVIKSYAGILAKEVRIVLNLHLSEEFLQTIYTPFVSYSNTLYLSQSLGMKKGYINNYSELLTLGEGLECRGELGLFLNEIQINTNLVSNLIFNTRLNFYEKIIFRIFGISFKELKNYATESKSNIIPDVASRNYLSSRLSHYSSHLSDLVEILPLSIFEGMKEKIFTASTSSVQVHWLGQIFNESYLFFLAGLKENGTVVIGQPHGGAYCQMQDLLFDELAERSLSDIYHLPIWATDQKAFPNWRASRNLFLQLKNLVKTKVKKNKFLVLLNYHYEEVEPQLFKKFVKDVSINDFYINQLKNLENHFSASYDFKLYVRQNTNTLHKFDFLQNYYPDSELIFTDRSVLEISRNYEAVIHIAPWATAIIELSTSRISQYVYLGPELLLNKDYELFLWNSKKNSTKSNYICGSYILIDNIRYRSAYGASFFYPFYFAKLIKMIIRRAKTINQLNFLKYQKDGRE
jgi:hypothetical protein